MSNRIDTRIAQAKAAPSWSVKVAVWVMKPGPMARGRHQEHRAQNGATAELASAAGCRPGCPWVCSRGALLPCATIGPYRRIVEQFCNPPVHHVDYSRPYARPAREATLDRRPRQPRAAAARTAHGDEHVGRPRRPRAARAGRRGPAALRHPAPRGAAGRRRSASPATPCARRSASWSPSGSWSASPTAAWWSTTPGAADVDDVYAVRRLIEPAALAARPRPHDPEHLAAVHAAVAEGLRRRRDRGDWDGGRERQPALPPGRRGPGGQHPARRTRWTCCWPRCGCSSTRWAAPTSSTAPTSRRTRSSPTCSPPVDRVEAAERLAGLPRQPPSDQLVAAPIGTPSGRPEPDRSHAADSRVTASVYSRTDQPRRPPGAAVSRSSTPSSPATPPLRTSPPSSCPSPTAR